VIGNVNIIVSADEAYPDFLELVHGMDTDGAGMKDVTRGWQGIMPFLGSRILVDSLAKVLRI